MSGLSVGGNPRLPMAAPRYNICQGELRTMTHLPPSPLWRTGSVERWSGQPAASARGLWTDSSAAC